MYDIKEQFFHFVTMKMYPYHWLKIYQWSKLPNLLYNRTKNVRLSQNMIVIMYCQIEKKTLVLLWKSFLLKRIFRAKAIYTGKGELLVVQDFAASPWHLIFAAFVVPCLVKCEAGCRIGVRIACLNDYSCCCWKISTGRQSPNSSAPWNSDSVVPSCNMWL